MIFFAAATTTAIKITKVHNEFIKHQQQKQNNKKNMENCSKIWLQKGSTCTSNCIQTTSASEWQQTTTTTAATKKHIHIYCFLEKFILYVKETTQKQNI